MQSGKVACITRELEDLLMIEEERGTLQKKNGSVADLLAEMETAVAQVEAQRERRLDSRKKRGQKYRKSPQRRSLCGRQLKHRNRNRRCPNRTENQSRNRSENWKRNHRKRSAVRKRNRIALPVRRSVRRSVCAGRNGKTKGCSTRQMP